MAGTEDSAPDRRASWVALRTLRQRPAVVGRTEAGETMYEIRSVRAVLPAGAAHFHRLVRCTKCDREVPGPPLVTPADLDQPAHPVFCDRCARSPAAAPQVPQKKEAPRALVAQPRTPPVVGEKPSEDVSVDRRRLAAVEARLAEVLSRLPPTVDEDDLLRRLSNQVAGALREQNAELGKISASVSEVRNEMGALAEANRQLAQVQADLDQRMQELTAHVAAHPGAETEANVARELDEIRAGLPAMIEATAQPLQAALAEGFDRQRAEIAALEERIRDESAAVTALLDGQRSEITQALHDVAQETLMAVAEPLRDLTMAREDFERRLQALQESAQEGQRRVEELNASAEAGASRLHALEQKIHASVQRLIHPVEGRPPGALLESLEQQLREAEERLTER